jgi:formyltetrahydrofolate hydrolase
MRNLVIALFLSLVGASVSQAQISKSEMLSKIDKDKISFQRAPLFQVQEEITKKLLERTKARYPKFKESMWYYQYVIQDGFFNIVFFDWTGEECLYVTLKQDAVAKKSKEIVSFISNQDKGNATAKRERIPIKYCEKLYNFYSDKKE